MDLSPHREKTTPKGEGSKTKMLRISKIQTGKTNTNTLTRNKCPKTDYNYRYS